MRKDCDTCLHDEFGETYCNDCYWATGKPPTKWEPAPFWTPDTNADRIRAMSDEELAETLSKTMVDAMSYCYGIKEPVNKMPKEIWEGLVKEYLEWLKQPAEE